ncbi:Uma2 family endonuclease [Paludisphaera rhizosphaerae]|uniref:Uma2 family endonuclease n=1 Tax=Paludisphaera rhizosphaerae TaxID=2711216 RepID=UPI0013EB787B|nr:Uma2 family endonuclease [Paludisphaera rhizosphaerae]
MSPTTLERAATESTTDDHPPETMLVVPEGVRLIVGPEDFERLCYVPANRDLRLERSADGGLTVMAPASSEGGERNLELGGQLRDWNKANRLGRAYDSSAGFTMPNGAVLSPDASWIAHQRWDALPAESRSGFARIAPDFVAELRSPSDTLKDLQAKMAEYIAQGVRLGWLIDPISQTVEIHRPGREPEILAKPATLSGEDVLPGLVLDLKGILFD